MVYMLRLCFIEIYDVRISFKIVIILRYSVYVGTKVCGVPDLDFTLGAQQGMIWVEAILNND